MRQHKAARMLGQMPRRADKIAGQVEGKAEPPVAHIEIEVLGVFRIDIVG